LLTCQQKNIKLIKFNKLIKLMKVINLGERSSVLNSYMAQLRDVDVQTNRTLFRRNMQRVARAIAYEVSRTLDYSEKTITTPLGTKEVPTYDDCIVVGTVLRAGVAFHEGFLDTFDQADSAFVAAHRDEGRKEDIQIHVDYIAAPQLDGCTFLMVDPMLATGGSLELSYKAFLSHGTPAKLHICCVIAAQEGIDHLCRVFPDDDVTLWVAAIDPILNDQAYIVPGLGDAGDLSFGPKL
jgi:uracil phosphoribosyltransferase